MSKVALSGNASGSGTLTIAAPNTSTDRTINLPDSNGTILTTATAGVPVNGPAFSAYPSSDQSVTLNTATKILFGAEDFDTNSNFASSRFTPTVAGYYQISGGVQVASALTNILLFVYKNGASVKLLQYTPSSAGAASGSMLVYMNGSTDYLELYATIGATQSLSNGAAGGTFFQAFLARSAT